VAALLLRLPRSRQGRYLGGAGRQRPPLRARRHDPGDGRVVGHAGFERERDHPERAEVALEIADAAQGKGLGTTLLRQLAEAARQLGIEVLDAEVLTENHKVLQVLRDCGYPVRVHSLRGAQLVELETSQAATPQVPREPRTQAA
jgi:RimJ/RimL family protein N-acetyltransferase